jgi:hypothetical protein
VLLLVADWEAWFDEERGVPKTHREHVWWTSLLFANRRIFLLHAVSLATILLLANRLTAPPPSAPLQCLAAEIGECASSWGAWALAPYLLLLSPALALAGRWHEFSSNQVTTTAARVRAAAWLVVIMVWGAILVGWVQRQMSICELKCAMFQDWLGDDRHAQLAGAPRSSNPRAPTPRRDARHCGLHMPRLPTTPRLARCCSP